MSKPKSKRDGVVEWLHPDGSITYSRRHRDATGRQGQVKLGNSKDGWTRERAAQAVREAKVDVSRDGLRHATNGPTLSAYVAEFLASYPTLRGLKGATATHYAKVLGRCLPALGHRTLTELEQRHELIERWATEALRSGREDGGPLGARTVNHTLEALSTLFNRARKAHLVRSNPLELVDRPRVPKPKIVPATAAQVGAIIGALRTLGAESTKPVDRAIFATAASMATLGFGTGMRLGEMLGLRWRDVDFLGGLVHVRAAYSLDGHGAVKSDDSVRTLELGPAVRAALEAHYAGSAWQGDDDLVFPHPVLGTVLDGGNLRGRFMRPALTLAGMPKGFRPFHDQRHTALTFSAAVNPAYVVKAQAGHASSAVTDRYVRLAGTLMAGHAAKTEALLFGGEPG